MRDLDAPKWNGQSETVEFDEKRKARRTQKVKEIDDQYEWGKFFWVAYRVYPHASATLLMYLWSKYRAVKAEERYGGWFYCPMKEICHNLGIAHQNQSRSMTDLKRRGVLELKKWGDGNRMIRLNFDKIRSDFATSLDYKQTREEK